MNDIGKPERATQDRVIGLFQSGLGYAYLGDWSERGNNRCVEPSLLKPWLEKQGYSAAQIARALDVLGQDLGHTGRDLYYDNQAVYERLRYGVPVKTEAGRVTESVFLIDWDNPTNNDFGIAEEVTLRGGHERRPDLVLYVNGIAVAVIELKSSRVGIGEGIRQLLSNQTPAFNADFFRTVQLVFAGSDSEGLKYGTIGTPEKFFLRWKEDEDDSQGFRLDKYLAKMCRKDRLIELMRDFVLFDGGVKKVPRVHQYFGVKAAQQHVERGEGGIIWHTQGSGKSIIMVLLARWILENRPHARVAVITDRDELDRQIVGVFEAANEEPHRAKSGRDLMNVLARPSPRLVCSRVHKFGLDARGKSRSEFDDFIEALGSGPSRVVGELFVFVDECHRTQSGRLHKAMKALLPEAVFMGFTGTPLLKKDKATSREVFGRYIHTYTFGEAVEDGVVLDLVYEARDIDQNLGSTEHIDQWFEAKTAGLNDWQKNELKKSWGTLRRVLSSRARKDRVVKDIVFDFSCKPRLSSERGNAILVARSILDACQYYELFQKTPLKGKCAIVTSYDPKAADVSKEETGANTDTDRQTIYYTYTGLLKDVQPQPGQSRTQTYEERAKRQFREEPARMKLLIVVDKLLTGFDAPPCTYLYIDKSMQDHGLFQAICRTNRLDGEDKPYGCIVDYRDLFQKLVNDKGTGALQVYSSELDDSAEGADPAVLMQDRLDKGRERLDAALERFSALCEPVPPPRDDLAYLHYFCGNTEIALDLKEREPRRVELYKTVAELLRAWANLADDLPDAGYRPLEGERMHHTVNWAVKLRDVIRNASGETLDLKPYEADMRHLIDTYVEASAPHKVSPFEDTGLLELIRAIGMDEAVQQLPDGIKDDRHAVAETIENNVRRKIVKAELNDPEFYAKMSDLLDEVIRFRKEQAHRYEEYLQRMAKLVEQVQAGHADDTPDVLKKNPAMRALFNNLHVVGDGIGDSGAERTAWLELAQKLDGTIRRSRQADWRGNPVKERNIKRAMLPLLNNDAEEVERLFRIIEQRESGY